MSRLNLVAKVDASFPDKTAYRHTLGTGEIIWKNSHGREKWRWVPTIVEHSDSKDGSFYETEAADKRHRYHLESHNPLRLFEKVLARNNVKVLES